MSELNIYFSVWCLYKVCCFQLLKIGNRIFMCEVYSLQLNKLFVKFLNCFDLFEFLL